MSKQLVDADSYAATVTSPVAGDAVTGAGIEDGLQDLTNRAHFLKLRTYAGQAADRMEQPLTVPAGFWASSATSDQAWGPQNSAGSPIGITQRNVVGHTAIFLPVCNLPKNGKIVQFGMNIDPAGAHGGLPAQMPRIKLYRTDIGSSSAPTLVSDTTDTTALLATYELPHAVASTALTEAIAHDGGYTYFAVITGEDSTNAVAGLVITSLYVLVDPS